MKHEKAGCFIRARRDAVVHMRELAERRAADAHIMSREYAHRSVKRVAILRADLDDRDRTGGVRRRAQSP
jgi:hypothetical protein